MQESVNHDGTFTVKAAPERVGYEFKGWTDGSGLYFDGDVYVADGGTITLVATWEYRVLTVEFLDDKGEAFETKRGALSGRRHTALPTPPHLLCIRICRLGFAHVGFGKGNGRFDGESRVRLRSRRREQFCF